MYNSSKKLHEVIKRNRLLEIPYDTQWTDIDAMNSRKDFTYDPVNFPDLPEIVKDLHAHNQHYINIFDPAISNTKGYYPYDRGLEMDIFIKQLYNDDPLVGSVWPGTTVFPDFTNPNATLWWTEVAAKFNRIIDFEGIWIDMNEPSNFVDGSVKGCTNSSYDKPPYTPRVLGECLYSRTVCPSARQYISNQYNLHNMYGHFEAIASFNALKQIKKNKRPFVLSRSTFAGSGQFTAHWSGDIKSKWEDLFYTIPNMLNFNMFGISMVGSDVCGFGEDTTEELCIRWMQLGSFYPFMRNHNAEDAKDQDPAVFSKSAVEIFKKFLNVRYSLLPYLYTLYFKSHTQGETVVRPLFFEYTKDVNTHLIDKQFLFGPALMITPVLLQNATQVNAYFPDDTWYDYETGELIPGIVNITLDTPLDKINIHMRGGFIIATQIPSVTTFQSRRNPFNLIVALKEDPSNSYKYAQGYLYWDDGESYDSIEQGNFNYFIFNATQDDSMVINV